MDIIQKVIEKFKTKEVWVCEACAEFSHGENPPDNCPGCNADMFDNLQDLLDEAERKPSADA